MELAVRGSWVALVTPFDTKGRIDQKCLKQLVSWHLRQGTEAIVCCGTTGEGITLSDLEKKKVVSLCIDAAEGKIPIIANTGTADTRQSVKMTELMLRLGASGCLAVAPYYNRPTQRGCILHFSEIAKVGLPVIVYNNPARGVKLEVETVAEIAKLPSIAGYKDSTGDLSFIQKIIKSCSIPVMSGDDYLTYDTLKEGGVGAISVVGNLVPRSWKKLIRFALEKKWDESKKIADRYKELIQAISRETNPQGVKFAMGWLGHCNEDVRLPLVTAEKFCQNQIRRALIALSLPQFRFPQEIEAAPAALPDGIIKPPLL